MSSTASACASLAALGAVGEGLDVWEVDVSEAGGLDERESDDDEQPEAVSARTTAATPAAVRVTVTPDHLPAHRRPSIEAALCSERTCDPRRLPTPSGDTAFPSPSLALPVWVYLAVVTRSGTAS